MAEKAITKAPDSGDRSAAAKKAVKPSATAKAPTKTVAKSPPVALSGERGKAKAKAGADTPAAVAAPEPGATANASMTPGAAKPPVTATAAKTSAAAAAAKAKAPATAATGKAPAPTAPLAVNVHVLPAASAAAAGALSEAPRPRKPSRSTSKYFVAQTPTPLPAPTSRFADRFAPPRPPTRQMNNVELDVPKHAQKSDPKLANAWKSKSGRELSEPEIFAMPESEYMNEKQLEFFRARLQALKDDLLSNAGETTEHLREDTSIVPDPADRATIEEEHALELRTRDRERKLLKKISQSLARIESGDYGFCDETGEPIGLGRLIARPTATLSLEAQQRRELKQKMFGD